MLKLNASFSKKVPAESQFSSKSYHASIEIELPDGLTPEQLQGRIHDTFALVRDSVENEIGGRTVETPAPQVNANAQPEGVDGYVHSNGNGRAQTNGNARKGEPASNKQIKYLVDLAAQAGADMNAMLRKHRAASVYDLDKAQCSALIDEIGGTKSTRFRKAA